MAIERPDREDLTAQRQRLALARGRLADALYALADEAADAAKPLRSRAKRPPEPDIDPVRAAMTRVRDAENEYDMARADLATASGADL